MTPARRFSGYAFVAPYLILFCLFVLFPLASGLRLSLTDNELVSPAPEQFVGLANYHEALGDQYFWRAFFVTVKLVVLTVPLIVLCALFLATALAGVAARRQGLYRAIVYLPGMLTVSVVGVLWRWIYAPDYGILDAVAGTRFPKIPWLGHPVWALIAITLMTVWWTVGGTTIILLAGLQSQPEQFLEAAQLDGANAWQRFCRVRVPLLKPVLLFTVVMNTIGSFQIFGQTFIVTKGGPEYATRTLVQYIYETAFNNYRMGYAASMSWLLFLAIAVFSVIQFRLAREQ